jgi:hypothetical protein
VNVAQLQAELTALGVDASAYSLAGGRPHGRLVLDHEVRGPWAVYYCDRGQKSGYQPFDAESAACQFFLGAMRQFVTKAHRVADEAGTPGLTGRNPELEVSALRRKR